MDSDGTADTDRSLFIGLTASGTLFASNGSGSQQLLAQNSNSFTVASGFLIFTTTAHVVQFAPLVRLVDLLAKGGSTTSLEALPEWEVRRVERGSRIVTVVPSTMSLVLQMPRGNLETIYPRPLVMNVVKQDIDR